MSKLLATILLIILIFQPVRAQTSDVLYPNSPLRVPIPADATYTLEPRIGSFRQGYEEWSMPICRPTFTTPLPMICVTVSSSDRTEHWHLPPSCQPATEADHHMGVINQSTGYFYEVWDAQWENSLALDVGGAVAYPLDGDSITSDPTHRTSAAGFSIANGMIIREDFLTDSGDLDPNAILQHGIEIALPSSVINGDADTGFIAPAIGAETQGTAGSSGIPMGMVFALRHSDLTDSQIDAMTDLHPFTRMILRAALDYGLYVIDSNAAADYEDLATATLRVEPGLLEDVYGDSSDDLIPQIQSEVYAVVERYHLWAVTTSPSEGK